MRLRLLPLAFPALAAAMVLFQACGSDNTAGITTIGNTVAGVVVDDKGNLVANAEVRLINASYNPATDAAEKGYTTVRTDAKGGYSIPEVMSGDYNLEVTKEGVAAIHRGIHFAGENDKDTLPNIELSKPGAITIVFGRTPVKLGGHFYMPGTTRHRPIDADAKRIGSLNLPYVAKGQYGSVFYQGPEETTGTEVLAPRTLEIEPADTVIMIPNANWALVRKVTLNTSATGANVSTDVIDYPALVRLTSPTFDFSKLRKDGADIRFLRPNGTVLPFYVSRYDSAEGAAEVWVKLDTVFGNSRTQSFYIFAGNPDSASLSDVKSVFPSYTGYAGLWHFDDASTLADAVGGNTAINHGAEGVEGVIGKAVRFRGSAWMDVPAKAFTGIARKISISFWQKSGDTLQNQPGDIFGGVDAAGEVVLRMHDPFGDTTVYWAAGGLDIAPLDRVEKRTDAEAQNRSRWNYWALTKDADKGEMKIYLNGKVWASATGKSASIGVVQSFILGFSGTDSYALDEFRVSRSVGTDDRIKLSYEMQKAGSTTVLIGK